MDDSLVQGMFNRNEHRREHDKRSLKHGSRFI